MDDVERTYESLVVRRSSTSSQNVASCDMDVERTCETLRSSTSYQNLFSYVGDEGLSGDDVVFDVPDDCIDPSDRTCISKLCEALRRAIFNIDIDAFKYNLKLFDFLVQDDLREMAYEGIIKCFMYSQGTIFAKPALFYAIEHGAIDILERVLEGRYLSVNHILDCIEFAIQSNNAIVVKFILTHPKYKSMDKSEIQRTAMTIAARENNLLMVQLVYNIEGDDAKRFQLLEQLPMSDVLKKQKHYLELMRAQASPAYLSLTQRDPIGTALDIRSKILRYVEERKEFKSEFLELVNQCEEFACSMLDHCSSLKEVEDILHSDADKAANVHEDDARYPAVVNRAFAENAKSFIAHPICQNYLSSSFYGSIRVIYAWVPVLLFSVISLLFMRIVKTFARKKMVKGLMQLQGYFFNDAKEMCLIDFLRSPVIKFLNHTFFNAVFLVLLGVMSFNTEDVQSGESWHEVIGHVYRMKFRTASYNYMTISHWIVFAFVLGFLRTECLQLILMSKTNVLEYFRSGYNLVDMLTAALYLVWASLRILVQQEVAAVADKYAVPLQQIRDIMYNRELMNSENGTRTLHALETHLFSQPDSYYIRGSRALWDTYDPMIISEACFAIANVLSFTRLSVYILPASESLGPLQISASRMVGDIARFLTMFLMFFVAFLSGIRNLYTFYSFYVESFDKSTGRMTTSQMTQSFPSQVSSMGTLFWSLFGMAESSAPDLEVSDVYRDSNSEMINPDAFLVPEKVGTVLFGLFNGIMVIVLLNMLIAMMSKSYDKTQEDADVEWKFARSELWKYYSQEAGMLPSPLNVIPTADDLVKLVKGCLGVKKKRANLLTEDIELCEIGGSGTHKVRKACQIKYIKSLLEQAGLGNLKETGDELQFDLKPETAESVIRKETAHNLMSSEQQDNNNQTQSDDTSSNAGVAIQVTVTSPGKSVRTIHHDASDA
ncbi:short transient receptor potential channel 3-like [Tubulanus polymorphus]|uniref:short transient receptor potential channel 3-like n=1 Tax=Tubulanus polymorphus TaxID=672921 RepID=UPI003DA4876C